MEFLLVAIAGLLAAILAALSLRRWWRLARTRDTCIADNGAGTASKTIDDRIQSRTLDGPNDMPLAARTGAEETGAPAHIPSDEDASEAQPEEPTEPASAPSGLSSTVAEVPVIPGRGGSGKHPLEQDSPSVCRNEPPLLALPLPDVNAGSAMAANTDPDQGSTFVALETSTEVCAPCGPVSDAPDVVTDTREKEVVEEVVEDKPLHGLPGTDWHEPQTLCESEVEIPQNVSDPPGFNDDAGSEKSVGIPQEASQPPLVEPALELHKLPVRRPRQPTVHRDRRGKRRTIEPIGYPKGESPETQATPAHQPAEAKLRLSLHPIHRSARLSVILTRPDGFPERVIVRTADEYVVEAYDEQRYDDLDLPWTAELLDGELRLATTEGFQWLRSARQVHIFSEDPNEPGLISVSAARAGVAHTLLCRCSDFEVVREAAASAGSPDLKTHEHWQGIPDGWMVLSGYTPVHAAVSELPAGFRPLDPGAGLEISFEGGLGLRPRVYAERHPPRIVVNPSPAGASVTIGGVPAILSPDGAWVAPGWDAPGQHMVDVVPGPSASYEIVADPWLSGGWEFWNAYPDRFGNEPKGPWAQAEICGAQIRGPADETVIAAQTQPTLVALGAKWGATPLQRRDDIAVSVGFMTQHPAFLIAASGQRRKQGWVTWLGLAPVPPASRRHDPDWVAAVRSAAVRRFPLDCSDPLGEDAWRKAKLRARRLKRSRA